MVHIYIHDLVVDVDIVGKQEFWIIQWWKDGIWQRSSKSILIRAMVKM
jgi:hypothetical protein